MWKVFEIYALYAFTDVNALDIPEPSNKHNHDGVKFEDAMSKYAISHTIKKYEDYQKKNRRTMIIDKKIIDTIDPFEELLKFDIDDVKVDPEVLNQSRRQFEPAGKVVVKNPARDSYGIKPRLYELMKQSIYQARDAIADVQLLRRKYKWHSLYKMGFLFSKTDDQVKLFSQLSSKVYQACRFFRYNSDRKDRLNHLEINEMIERLLNHWFEVDLLVDIIRINDDSARKTLRHMTDLNELDSWFIDEFFDVFEIMKATAAAKKARAKAKEVADKKKKKREEKKGDKGGGVEGESKDDVKGEGGDGEGEGNLSPSSTEGGKGVETPSKPEENPLPASASPPEEGDVASK